MKEKIQILLKYYLFWVIYFSVGRFVFVLYNNKKIENVLETSKSFYYGMFMDLSISSYIMLIVGILFFVSFFISKKIIVQITKYLSLVLIIIITFLIIVDIELYSNWGFRIDNTIFFYLVKPKEALSSSSIWLILILLIVVGLYIKISYYFVKKIINKLEYTKNIKWYYSFVFLGLSTFMIIPIRGGISLSPINIGTVYYSKNQFCNHSAINPVWNFFKTIIESDNEIENVFFYDKKEVLSIFNEMKEEDSSKEYVKLLKIGKPNIIIIMLESFSYNCLENLGGKKGITPNIDKLIEEGILFENCIANGNRTDRGIPSILSGYPTQAKKSIINNVKKAEKLPNLGIELKKLGYSNSFYYGGDINFFNIKSYMVMGGFERLITDKYFKKENQNSWGAFDEYVLEKMHEDTRELKKPFFNVLLTITSHEPFTTPRDFIRIFEDNSDENRYLNSINYTDKSIGNFIEKSKKEKWYDSTLIILVSDHGHKYPGDKEYSSLENFRIPMIWLGGALKLRGKRIKEYLNQSDLAVLLGDELSCNWRHIFPFSKNIFKNKENYANYSFNNGIGFFNSEDGFIWDMNLNKYILDPKDKKTEQKGKSFFQILIEDYETK